MKLNILWVSHEIYVKFNSTLSFLQNNTTSNISGKRRHVIRNFLFLSIYLNSVTTKIWKSELILPNFVLFLVTWMATTMIQKSGLCFCLPFSSCLEWYGKQHLTSKLAIHFRLMNATMPMRATTPRMTMMPIQKGLSSRLNPVLSEGCETRSQRGPESKIILKSSLSS